tara:strand:- start:137 stop:568 length:432 start_codon:yes stop_codon:yes gene_type:complete
MKKKSILYIIITCLSLYHVNGYASSTTCNANDTACIAKALNDSDNSGNAALLVVIGLVAVVGYIALSKKIDKATTEETASFRAKEIANGYGIRLNSMHSPVRISLFPSKLNHSNNNMQVNNDFHNIESPKFPSNYLSFGINFK